MVKMKEVTPMGGDKSVRLMVENYDGGHECSMMEEGEDRRLYRKK